MSRRRRASFTISWPFIIACIVGYNIFFGDDSDDKKSTETVDQETPAIVQSTDQENSIDATVEKIKNEIKTSEVIQSAKKEFSQLKEEVMSEVKKDWSKKEETKPEQPKEKEAPVMQAEEEPETPPVIESPKEEETSLDNMKSL